MNREIRFRAWHNRKMLYHNPMMSTHDFIITPDGKVFYTDEPGYVNGKNHDSVIMQYTGLKDKNSKEIYEGDIVRTYMGNICEIRWDFVSESKHQDYEYTGFCFHHLKQGMNYHLDVTSSCEIIGNIWENPELLKDETKS